MAYKTRLKVVASCFVVASLILCYDQPATAQSGDFTELQGSTRPGDTLVVTTQDDKTVKGRLVNVDASTIVLLLDGQRTTLLKGSVKIVERRDHLSNGARNGFWVGLAASAIPVSGIGYICHKESGIAECLPAMLGIAVGIGGIGAAIGALVDAARLQVLYRAPQSGTTTSLRPLLFKRGDGWAAGLKYSYSRP